MSSIQDIPVEVTFDPSENTGAMLDAVFQELLQLMNDYVQKDVQGAIDIKSLPLSDEDYKQLEQRLGKGEVSIRAQLAGDTDIYETAYAGVWWIRHRNMDDRIIAEHLEVGKIPTIVCAHNEDIRQAHQRLKLLLDSST